MTFVLNNVSCAVNEMGGSSVKKVSDLSLVVTFFICSAEALNQITLSRIPKKGKDRFDFYRFKHENMKSRSALKVFDLC